MEERKLSEMKDRAVELLDIIAMEFRTDSASTQCFDLRVVQEAIELTKVIRDEMQRAR